MLFHSSIRKELARTFGATLVILITVVMTTTVIRTLGEATRGMFNPTDVMMIMGYSLLSQLPAILSFSLFLAIVSVLTRMYRDSEMVIWLGSGRGLTSLIRPLLGFAWPVFVLILTMALLVLPWAFTQIEDLRDQYQKRSDVSRVEPGQFQESANGDKVFFIDKDSSNKEQGINVFMVTRERGSTPSPPQIGARWRWMKGKNVWCWKTGSAWKLRPTRAKPISALLSATPSNWALRRPARANSSPLLL